MREGAKCHTSDFLDYRVGESELVLRVRLQPRASRSGPLDIYRAEKSYLKWAVASPPVDGKANWELIKALSSTCSLAKSSISVRTGLKSRNKELLLRFPTASQACAAAARLSRLGIR